MANTYATTATTNLIWTTANSAFAKANNALDVANSGWAHANAAYNYANTITDQSLFTTDNVTFATVTVTGNTTVQHVIPSANIVYDIGATNSRFRDLYLSGNTIFLGDAVISSSGNTVVLPQGTTIGGFSSNLSNLSIQLITSTYELAGYILMNNCRASMVFCVSDWSR